LECDELNDMLALCLPGVLNINWKSTKHETRSEYCRCYDISLCINTFFLERQSHVKSDQK
jgi:hypothetical protein